MKITFFLFFAILLSIRVSAQKLPKEFAEGLSNMIHPMFSSQDTTMDMYAVAVLLSPEGKVLKTLFSQGTPDSVKSQIVYRVSITRIGLTPLTQYWKKFCTENSITDNTCIIQPLLIRFENTDAKTFTVDEITEKYTKAMNFGDQLIAFKQKLNVIWLKPKASRLVYNQVVD